MPETGTFLSKDPVESEPPYQYVRGNPVNHVDPYGYQGYSPGFIEEGIDVTVWNVIPTGKPLGPDVWLVQALKNPIVEQVHKEIQAELQARIFSDIQHLYGNTKAAAEKALAGKTCSDIEEWRESAHIALITLAAIARSPDPQDRQAKDSGPVFIGGVDTTWHFFLHSFVSFEYLYSSHYDLTEHDELEKIWKVAAATRGKARAVEYAYQDQTGDKYLSLSSVDMHAFYTAAYAGNTYEVHTTYTNQKAIEANNCSQFTVLIGTIPVSIKLDEKRANLFCMGRAVTDSLENFEKLIQAQDPDYERGVRDPRVWDDLRANHLGARFGIDAFYYPDALPPTP